MTPSQLIQTIRFIIRNGLSLLITAQPGVGKSDITEFATAEEQADFMIMHPSVADPTDFKGIPAMISKTEAAFLPFTDLKRLMDATKKLVCFIDDLGQAPPAVQAAIMQLILARQINGKKISDHVVFIAATNRKQDKAAVSGILEPVKSRFSSIVELEVSNDDWINWALTKGNMPIELISFIRFRPEMLNKFVPSKDMVNSPVPRTVANVGKLQNAGIPSGLEMELIKGAAGEAFAAEYTAYLTIFKNLPNIDQILMSGQGDVPTEPAVLYAVSGVLASRITAMNAANAFNYISKLPAEIGYATIKDAVTKNRDITNTKAFIQWASDNGNVLFN